MALHESPELRTVSILLDYHFGRGVGKAAPKTKLRLVYSRRSGRLKLIFHDGKLFATVRPAGSMALTVYAASILARSRSFRQNFVQVADETSEFVKSGKSVFCKFVRWAGKNIHPLSEVVVVDSKRKVLGVGTAVLNGKHMATFSAGVAVKVRKGRESPDSPS
jgi:predicted RNA-binding protein (TIGR00451 family)